MKLIENFSDYDMAYTDNTISNKHNYIRYRIGRLKHNFWLKSRKSATTVYIDEYDNYVVKNLQSGSTCYFGSAGYYVEDIVSDLTVIETHPIVKEFYPDAIIIKERSEIGIHYPNKFDNFVVMNNRSDLWATLYQNDEGIPCLQSYFIEYIKAMNLGCKFFYSFRDTQIPCWNRLNTDHYSYFYNFGLACKKIGLKLIWHDIQFAEKNKQPDGSYDMLENPDSTNGNIKFIFERL